MNRISVRGVTAALAAGGVLAGAGAVALPALAAATGSDGKQSSHVKREWATERATVIDWQRRGVAPAAKPKPKPKPKPTATDRASRSSFRSSLSGSPREIAHAMLLRRGWSEAQWPCLNALWQRESGWNPYAVNASSGAYGIPQALPGSKMSAVGADWRTNPVTQITWGLDYISSRYGTPCAAYAYSNTHNYY